MASVDDRFELSDEGLRVRRLFGDHTWPWSQIGAISWGDETRFGTRLVVCLLGDPYPRVIARFLFRYDVARDELERLRPQFERFGVSVENRDEGANLWWWADQRSKPTK